jgi:ESS family glutamate:Na+ symporter
VEALHIKPVDTLISSIVVLYLGSAITSRVEFLQRYSIPRSVTGGLLVSLLILLILKLGGLKITFDLQLRDILLLAFFSTIGLSAKISRLKTGGKTLGLLVLCAGVFLVVQETPPVSGSTQR